MLTGTIQPARAVDLGSQVSGTIRSIEADFNDTVRAGQIVARLDPSAHEAQLAEAQAKLAQARAEHARLHAILDDARAKLSRAERLSNDEQIARAELDLAQTTAKQTEAELKAADASIAAAQATMTEARVKLNQTMIRAPIDGIVISRHVEIGQTIAASVQTPVLFTIADLRRMQLLAEVAEADVGGVRQGSRVTFQVESIGDQPFEGTVSAVRLQPVLDVADATTAGGAASTPATIGTSGRPGAATTSSGGAAASTSAAASAPPGAPSGSPSPASPAPDAAASAARQPSAARTAASGVVTYTAVIDVNNVSGAVPPGGTAIITLDAAERRNVRRIPNNALSFHPSPRAFATVDQKPPLLDPPELPRNKPAAGTRRGYVWKFEHRRFVPIAIEAGLSDETWTELVSGELHSGDQLVTAAGPPANKK
jgi:HlyD family secretion protein